MLLGMVEIHNLDSPRKMFRGQVPASRGLHLPRSRFLWLAPPPTAEPSHTVRCQNPLWPCVELHSACSPPLAYQPRPSFASSERSGPRSACKVAPTREFSVDLP